MIIEMQNDVYYFENQQVPQGHYSFPFTVKLPAHLPPSFVFKGKEMSKLVLRYHLIAEIKDLSGKDLPIKITRVFVVTNSERTPQFNRELSLSSDMK